MADYVLEMKNIHKSFPGVRALRGVDFHLNKGEIHALMGENGAGKSTLMKCMFGIYHMDEGKVIYEGQEVQIKGPLDALNRGIAMVHQELQPIPARTVAENIWLGRYPTKKIGPITIVDHSKMYADTDALLKKLKLQINSHAKLGSLSIAQMQMVEIAKAVSANCKVLILDEPTSSLTANEVESLFRIMRELKEQGVALVYISHKMDEIKVIADEVTIMRDGHYIGKWDVANMTKEQIIAKMVGRELSNLYPPLENHPSDEIMMKVEDFTSIHPRSFRHCSFELKKGEILGVAGLMGAGRTELMKVLYGALPRTSGYVTLDGHEVVTRSPQDGLANGIVYISEDRKRDGLVLGMSVKENMSLTALRYFSHSGGSLKHKDEQQAVSDFIRLFNVKTPSMEQAIGLLSGGNQQKVAIARGLMTRPKVLILDEPTRGVDVGAKKEIYQLINQFKADGLSIILVSSEMPEVLGMSDRIIVMHEGHLGGEFTREQATQEVLMAAAVGKLNRVNQE